MGRPYWRENHCSRNCKQQEKYKATYIVPVERDVLPQLEFFFLEITLIVPSWRPGGGPYVFERSGGLVEVKGD